MKKVLHHSKKVLVGIIGVIAVLCGVVLIPYPGPGWLLVFLGFGILSTEFDWARNLLAWLRRKYDAWTEWVKAQPGYVKLAIGCFTLVVTALTVWLVNGYGLINNWFDLHQEWLRSPFLK